MSDQRFDFVNAPPRLLSHVCLYDLACLRPGKVGKVRLKAALWFEEPLANFSGSAPLQILSLKSGSSFVVVMPLDLRTWTFLLLGSSSAVQGHQRPACVALPGRKGAVAGAERAGSK